MNIWLKISKELDFHEKTKEKLNQLVNASEMIPLFSDLAVVYLRRIVDRFVQAITPALFEKINSVPRKMHKLVDYASQNEGLKNLNPICDQDILLDALKNHTDWLLQLRGFDKISGKKGIRDSIEHRSVNLHVVWKGKSPNVKAELRLFSHSQDVPQVDIIENIIKILHGLCSLWDKIHMSIKYSNSYDPWDSFPVSGEDASAVNLWPKIKEK